LTIADCRLTIGIGDCRFAISGLAIADWGASPGNRHPAIAQSPISNPAIANQQSGNRQSTIRHSTIDNPEIDNRESAIVNE
jgi:hypothetical protein